MMQLLLIFSSEEALEEVETKKTNTFNYLCILCYENSFVRSLCSLFQLTDSTADIWRVLKSVTKN